MHSTCSETFIIISRTFLASSTTPDTGIISDTNRGTKAAVPQNLGVIKPDDHEVPAKTSGPFSMESRVRTGTTFSLPPTFITT